MMDVIDDAVTPAGWWSLTASREEQRARLRAMRALVRVLAGRAGADAEEALAVAEWAPERIGEAVAAVERLPTIPLRRVLATYAAMHRVAP